MDQRGARLILSGRNMGPLDSLAAELTRAEAIAADLAQRDQLERLLAQIDHADILVANAARATFVHE